MNEFENNSFTSKELVNKYMQSYFEEIKDLEFRLELIENEKKEVNEKLDIAKTKLKTIVDSIEMVYKICSELKNIGDNIRINGNLPIIYKTYFDILGCDYRNIEENGNEYCIVTKVRNIEENRVK